MPIRIPRRLIRIAPRRAVAAAVLLAAARPAAAQVTASTPDSASPERAAILDALRPGVERRMRLRVAFGDVRVTVADGWAYVRAIPYVRPEDHADSLSDLRMDWQADPFVYALLRGRAGAWTVLEQAIGSPPGTMPAVPWAARYGAPIELFDREPAEAALEAAMRELIDAMAEGSGERFLALLPREAPVRLVNTRNAAFAATAFTRAQLAADFAHKTGAWSTWFGAAAGGGERGDDFYAALFQRGTGTRRMWRRGGGTVYHEPDTLRDELSVGARYVRWTVEDDRWVIQEIAFPLP